MPKQDKYRRNLYRNFFLFSVLVVSILLVGVYYVSLINNSSKIHKSPSINIVTIGNESYDAVVCPLGSTDSSCTQFGAAGMQDVINNAPDRPKENPFKIYIKKGSYSGFTPVIKLINMSGFTKKMISYFYINTNISILGEGKETTILDGGGTISNFFYIGNSSFINLSGIKLNYIYNNLYTDPDIVSSTGCYKTNSSDCYFLSGFAFIVNNYSTNKNILNINYLNVENMSGFLHTSLNSLNNEISIKNSKIQFINESALDIHSNTKTSIESSEFLALSTPKGPYEPMRLHGESVTSFKNSVIFWIDQPASSCLNMWETSKVYVTNSLFSNCMLNGISMTNSANATINNSIIQHGSLWGIRAYESSNAQVSYSFIYDYSEVSRVTKGVVTIYALPLNSKITDDPQIIFNSADYFAPNTLSFLTNSRSLHSGDPLLLNIDGTRSNIGPAGGPDMCLLRSTFPGCSLNPTVIPSIKPSPSYVPTITSLVSPTITPTSGILLGDMDNNKVLNVNDILLLIKAVFK